ncbi:hypothetical protein F7U66_00175 [Vibrio parahaemolyticus]|nr:hypothetical protein [Vibrio parahaemolyticus]
MEYVQIKPSTLSHSRALLAILAYGEMTKTRTLPKNKISNQWTNGQASRAAIIRACKDLVKMPLVDHRKGGKEFYLFSAVDIGAFHVHIEFNYSAENAQFWSELRQLLIPEGTEPWANIRSRYTLGLILGQKTSNCDYLVIEQLREMTGCIYSYGMDSSFVRDVMSNYEKDLGYMQRKSWEPNYVTVKGKTRARTQVVGYHVVE